MAMLALKFWRHPRSKMLSLRLNSGDVTLRAAHRSSVDVDIVVVLRGRALIVINPAPLSD